MVFVWWKKGGVEEEEEEGKEKVLKFWFWLWRNFLCFLIRLDMIDGIVLLGFVLIIGSFLEILDGGIINRFVFDSFLDILVVNWKRLKLCNVFFDLLDFGFV